MVVEAVTTLLRVLVMVPTVERAVAVTVLVRWMVESTSDELVPSTSPVVGPTYRQNRVSYTRKANAGSQRWH